MNAALIKLAGLVLMTADHTGYYFPDLPCARILRIAGRPSFVIFLFTLSESMFYTGSRTKYLLRLPAGSRFMLFAGAFLENLFHGKIFLANNIFAVLFITALYAVFTDMFVDAVKQKNRAKAATAAFLHLLPVITGITFLTTSVHAVKTAAAGGRMPLALPLLCAALPNLATLESGAFFILPGRAFCLARNICLRDAG